MLSGGENMGASAISVRHSETTQRTRLRLTRRGRIVAGTLVTILVSAALAAAALFVSPQALASADDHEAQEFGYVIVAPGASLWEVAAEIDASTDPRDLVAEIVRLNQFENSGVQAGQPVAVPLRYADHEHVIAASELGL